MVNKILKKKTKAAHGTVLTPATYHVQKRKRDEKETSFHFFAFRHRRMWRTFNESVGKAVYITCVQCSPVTNGQSGIFRLLLYNCQVKQESRSRAHKQSCRDRVEIEESDGAEGNNASVIGKISSECCWLFFIELRRAERERERERPQQKTWKREKGRNLRFGRDNRSDEQCNVSRTRTGFPNRCA